jgi:DUF1365 family protein
MLWLNIYELDQTIKKTRWLSHNRFNLFAFYDRDHLKSPDKSDQTPIKDKLQAYFESLGKDLPPHIFLLTHARILGYAFNPVSFYYCYTDEGNCTHIIAEVSNTFGEMKLFLIDQKDKQEFYQEERKLFYVSPFTDLDDQFEFRFQVPTDQLYAAINTSRNGQTYFYAVLTGSKQTLSNTGLLTYFFRLPLVTWRIITAIHWQAFKLWLKGIPYHKKREQPDLQQGIINQPTSKSVKNV